MSERTATRLAAFVLVSLLYISTMSRWIGAGDTALLLEQMHSGRFSSHVNSHNLSILVGWLAMKVPVGSIAIKGHWVSVAAGVAMMMAFQELAWRALQRPIPTVVATLAGAVTHTFWWHATIVENYCFNGLIVFAVTLLLLDDDQRSDQSRLGYAGFLAGLAMFNHMQMGILLPLGGVYALLRYWPDKAVLGRTIAMLVGVWVAGAAPFLGLLARDSGGGQHFEAAAHNAMGAQFTAIMFDWQPSELWPIVQHELFQQFPNGLLLLLPVGCVLALRSERWRVHAGLMAAFLVNTSFFLTYHTWDRYAFLLPSVAILWVWGLHGWAWLLDTVEERPMAWKAGAWALLSTTLWLPPWYHLQQVQWARDGGFGHGRFAGNTHWNTHDVGRYVAWPVKSEWDDMHVVLSLLDEQLPKNAVWIDDDARTHYSFDFYWRAMNGNRPDIDQRIINAWGFDNWGLPMQQMMEQSPKWLAKGRRVFTVSTFSPHREWQDALAIDHGYVPHRVDLTEDHWVYEMRPKPNTGSRLTVLEVQTGLRLKGWSQLLTHRIGTEDQRAHLRIRHLPLEQPTEVMVRFSRNGASPVVQTVPLDGELPRTVVDLSPEVQASPGRWRVDVLAGGVALSHAWIKVEEGVPDRRWR